MGTVERRLPRKVGSATRTERMALSTQKALMRRGISEANEPPLGVLAAIAQHGL
jgi:hypothetical protein